MNVTYHCPACQKVVHANIAAETTELACPHCPQRIKAPADAVESGRLDRCLVCPSTDLFLRKDFPQRLGVALVVIGFVGSSVAWANYQVFWTFAILFITALIDLVLYIVMGESLTCYRCNAQYRGVQNMKLHGGFDLETHERYRQMSARFKDARPKSVPASET